MGALDSTANLLQLLGEPSRARLPALLAEQELTVADLTQVTELAQSRVSTHLGKLRDGENALRERRPSYFRVIIALANKPDATRRPPATTGNS